MCNSILDIPAEFVIHDICHARVKDRGMNSKGELVVICPVSGKPLEVNLAKGGIWKCFRECGNCPAGGKGGLLDFYSLYYPVNNRREAAEQIMNACNGTIYEARKQQAAQIVAPTQSKRASIEDRDATYRKFLSMLPLSAAHRADLHKRGMCDDDIDRMMFRSIPQSGKGYMAQALESSGAVIDGVPGFYRAENGTPAINCHGSGYFIPYFDEHAHIVGMQIRYDVELCGTPEEIAEAKKRRYRMFTSSGKNGGAAAAIYPTYGIPGKLHKADVAYVTEGGLKAATAQSLSGGWFTAIPGVSCYAAFSELLDFFKANGVTIVVDAFDSDRATNPSVARSLGKLHQIAAEKGITMQSWNWGTEQKGVDDYLLAKRDKRRRT